MGSDHHLVHIKLKLKRTETPIKLLKCFDVSKLKDVGLRRQRRGKTHRRRKQQTHVELEG